MNKQPEIQLGQNGFIFLVSTPTIFELDLIGKNLQMNGIENILKYPDADETTVETPAVFVKAEQKENALSLISSLDLTDFTLTNGK